MLVQLSRVESVDALGGNWLIATLVPLISQLISFNIKDPYLIDKTESTVVMWSPFGWMRRLLSSACRHGFNWTRVVNALYDTTAVQNDFSIEEIPGVACVQESIDPTAPFWLPLRSQFVSTLSASNTIHYHAIILPTLSWICTTVQVQDKDCPVLVPFVFRNLITLAFTMILAKWRYDAN